MAKIILPDDKELANRVIEVEDRKDERWKDAGIMGIIFGRSSEKPGNIAGFSILLACIMITVVAYAPASAEFPKRELITLFGSIIPAALGYVFGALGSGKS